MVQTPRLSGAFEKADLAAWPLTYVIGRPRQSVLGALARVKQKDNGIHRLRVCRNCPARKGSPIGCGLMGGFSVR